MSKLTGDQRRRLKGQAHALKPRVQIGRNGVTEAAVANIHKALHDHELVKIKYLEHKDERKTLTARVAEETGSIIIDEIGNTATLYRRSPDPAKRNIDPGKP